MREPAPAKASEGKRRAPRGPNGPSKATMVVALVLLCGCEAVKQGIVGTHEALKRGDTATALVTIEASRKWAGEPKRPDQIPQSVEEARAWAKFWDARIQRWRMGWAALLSMVGVPGAATGMGGLGLAGIFGWLFKRRGKFLANAGKYIETLGRDRIENADQPKAEKEKMRGEQKALQIEPWVNRAVKEAKNGKG